MKFFLRFTFVFVIVVIIISGISLGVIRTLESIPMLSRNANEENVKDILKIEPGAITPLAVINDKSNTTKLVIDKDLINNKILVHPDTNTKTLSIDYIDLIRLIEYTNHEYITM